MNKRKIGTEYEEVAVKYLEKQGYLIVERNFRCRSGEIDIIAKDGNYLVFLEVKFRKNTEMGNAMEAVTPYKQRAICKVARYYLMLHHYSEVTPSRFDVIGITGGELQLVKDAFSYQ